MTQPELSTEERERVLLVTHILLSLFTRKRWSRLSVRQWLNRVLLLYQRPLTILVYRKQAGRFQDRWCLAFSSHRDYAYYAEFEAFLAAHHNKETPGPRAINAQDAPPEVGKDLRCLKGTWEPHAIPLRKTSSGDADFGLLLVGLEQKPAPAAASPDGEQGPAHHHGPNVGFRLLDPHGNDVHAQRAYDLLQALWCEFLGDPDVPDPPQRFSDHLGVHDRMRANLHKLFQVAAQNDGITPPEPLPAFSEEGKFPNGDLQDAFLERQLELIRERVVGPIHDAHSGTPLVSTADTTPENLFFYQRFYGQDETLGRNAFSDEEATEPYPYSVKMVLPPGQRAQITQALREMADRARPSDPTPDEWTYTYRRKDDEGNVMDSRGQEERILDECPGPSAYRKWFWESLKGPRDAQGKGADHTGDVARDARVEELLTLLESPLGTGARSLADPALASGFVHFRPSIFTQNFGVALSERACAIGPDGTLSRDLQRQILTYYLFTAATAAKNTTHPIGAMIVPVRVGTRTWMAVAHITEMAETAAQGRDVHYKEKDHIQAQHNIFLFSAIDRQAAQRARDRAKRVYLEQVEEIFYTQVKAWIFAPQDKRPGWEKLEKCLNVRFEWLGRVWPFPIVIVRFYHARPEEERVKQEDPDYQGDEESWQYVPFINAHITRTEVFFSWSEEDTNPYFVHLRHRSVSTPNREKGNRVHATCARLQDRTNLGFLSRSDIAAALKRANERCAQDWIALADAADRHTARDTQAPQA